MTEPRHPTRGAPEHPLYAISVAAELSGAAVQSIRLWEKRGLLAPHRSSGGTRIYSDNDLTRIARITALVNDGVNIAGIARILDLEDDNDALRAQRSPDGTGDNPSTQRIRPAPPTQETRASGG